MYFELDGRKCALTSNGSGGPVVFNGAFPDEKDLLPDMLIAQGMPLTLFTFELTDWRRDCAPWACEINGEQWQEGAHATLDWLKNSAIPYAFDKIGERDCLIAGYSMSGLLSMWLLYESKAFAGAACCSGSLWYPGWDTYIGARTLPRAGVSVYLSLGGKEAKSGPVYMKCIEERMRDQLEHLRADPNVKNTVLEMNPGGHFTKTTERLAKGITWLLKQQ